MKKLTTLEDLIRGLLALTDGNIKDSIMVELSLVSFTMVEVGPPERT